MVVVRGNIAAAIVATAVKTLLYCLSLLITAAISASICCCRSIFVAANSGSNDD